MAIRYSTAARNALADKITDLVNAGAGAGTLKVYTGSLPSDLVVGSSTLLASFTLADPAAAAAAAGVATWDFDPPISASVLADGTAGWFLVEDSTGADVFGGTVGTSGADLNFTSVGWLTNGVVQLTGGTYTQPGA